METRRWPGGGKANGNGLECHFCVQRLQVDSMRDHSGSQRVGRKIQEKAIEVEGTNKVVAADASPDATRFAAGTGRDDTSIWNIVTGERLVGPLQHDTYVVGVKFSPNGERVATACRDSLIRIFDSHNGDQLITIKDSLKSLWLVSTPLAWSNNSQQIFTPSQ